MNRLLYGCRALVVLAVVGMPLFADAGGARDSNRDSNRDRHTPLAVVRISDYLNNLRQFTARFVQVTDKGGYASGRLYIQRPGRMRVDYDLPNQLQIIADGSNVIFYDPSFNSINSMPLEEFPAGVLLGHAIDLGGERFRVASFEKKDNMFEVVVHDRQASGSASGGSKVRLFFSDNPLRLEQWSLKDARGENVRVLLRDVRAVSRLDPELFVFRPPRRQDLPPFRSR
ncbi:MAG: outer membrane lipoprotein carrier protein LolA [Alphaproteobacteria bacterium GM202ARS2]|nr:outer membrane lipoprotein carrier protein LolA [Alphaproteobacteria bacterium GM202ARS2]